MVSGIRDHALALTWDGGNLVCRKAEEIENRHGVLRIWQQTWDWSRFLQCLNVKA